MRYIHKLASHSNRRNRNLNQERSQWDGVGDWCHGAATMVNLTPAFGISRALASVGGPPLSVESHNVLGGQCVKAW